MPVTTRIQADAQGMTDEDMVSLDNPPRAGDAPEEATETGPANFDKSREYFPIFCLSNDIPEEYFAQLRSHTEESSPWLEITTSDPYSESILAQSKADCGRRSHARRSPPPFLDWNLSALYEFHKTLLRPLLTNQGRGSQFAYFTFLAIDAACFQSQVKNEWEIIVCSDAPDYNESPATGPKLKTFRLAIPSAMESLAAIEMMTSTPLEVGKKCAMGLSIMPPPFLAGPPPVAREMKWSVLAGLPEPEGEGVVEVLEL